MLNYRIEDFIGIFDGVVSPDYCKQVIDHYEQRAEYGATKTRKQLENIPKNSKDNSIYAFDLENDPIQMSVNHNLSLSFSKALWQCHTLYAEKYGTLDSLASYNVSECIKIQKTQPSEGYHIWHCEHGSIATGRRLLLVMLYLNDIEEGGETEFLYQSKRIQPKQGRLVICPGGWTHTHRGNPPLLGNKYMMNTWLEFSA